MVLIDFVSFLLINILGRSLLEPTINKNVSKRIDTRSALINNHSCGISLQVSAGNDRIVGGRTALDGEFPWQVSIRRYSSIEQKFVPICGGSIISDRWILTAAHCVFGVSEDHFEIVANITSLTESSDDHLVHKVSRIIIHDDFDEETNSNDISLVKLTEPLNLDRSNGHMGMVCLPKPSNGPGFLNDRGLVNFVTVTGWGTTDEEGDGSINLMAADVALVETEKCNSTYKGTISKGFICAGLIEGGKDSCQGDSGGPMIYRDPNNKAYLIGIVSWGEGCGRKGIPGVYVDVKYYLNWIYSNIELWDSLKVVS